MFTLLWLSLFAASASAPDTNSLGMKLVNVPAGKFIMGSAGYGENFDEHPAHRVYISKPFRMAATEVTNAQYEQFDPGHRALRGKQGFSKADDEAVIFINYEQATAFCAWLTKKEGKPYRLPTEAEWEYACRAGTLTPFVTGDGLDKALQKQQETVWTPKPVPLTVAQTPPNAWGLYDMHGNVEEWCHDWYGPYEAAAQTDPVGRVTGQFRVTRGGSHSTPVRYLRSANRLGMIPQDSQYLVGFRVVQADLPSTLPLAKVPLPGLQQRVKQMPFVWKKETKPFFKVPIPYVLKPTDSTTPFYGHNHCPALTWCANGDLLVIWFSTDDEAGREMTILGSRLRSDSQTWDPASEFFKVPDRNMTGSSLFHDGQGTLYHTNGVEAAGSWENLAMTLRTSTDNGATWTPARLIAPEHQRRNQVIAGMFMTQEGWLVQPTDASPWGTGGSALHISRDQGKTWEPTYQGETTTPFVIGQTGPMIAGIHAGVVQVRDDSLLALGRGDNLPGPEGTGPRMPMSRSTDGGKTWTYAPSELPPIAGGQRLVLRRLNEGPLLLVSFTNHPYTVTEEADKGMIFTDAAEKSYKGYGLYAALSFDEGQTWPVKKLLTDGQSRFLDGGAWTGFFEMDATHAEPRGYLAATQTPDNVIHLISSQQHYRLTLPWLLEKAKVPLSD